MEILLDTTVQIERIFKRAKKEKIEKIIAEHRCGSSTYVLGEYKSTIVKDFVALYNIMCMEDSLAGVREHINDTVFHRHFQRIYYIYNDICKLYNDDFELIKEHLGMYPKLLEHRFWYGLEPGLMDGTRCHRAKAKVLVQGKKAEIPDVNCSKKDNFCQSCEFFEMHREAFLELKDEKNLPEKMKNAIRKVLEGSELLKGDICRTLGDCIIALEALGTEGNMVCTTNEKDFRPICNAIGINMCQVPK